MNSMDLKCSKISRAPFEKLSKPGLFEVASEQIGEGVHAGDMVYTFDAPRK